MAIQSTVLGPTLASKYGDEIYELILSNWGNKGAGADAQSLQYPALSVDEPLPSVVGLAISPRSDIDRCVIQYQPNPLKLILTPASFYALGGVGQQDQLISVDRPWVGQINGPLVARADPAQWFNDAYLPAGGASSTFGTALAPGIFTAPTLRLLLYLRGLPSQPSRRSPLSYAASLFPAGAVGPQAEQLVKVLPVHGRRHVRIMLRGDTVGAGSSATVRVGGVVPGITGLIPGPAVLIESPECVLVPSTVLTPGLATCIPLDLPQVQYLTLYMDRAGVASVGGALVYVESID